MIAVATGVHVHFAHRRAFPTGHTLVFVKVKSVKRDLVEQRINRPKRTYILAKGTENDD